jgi:uncharacterized protein YkwD
MNKKAIVIIAILSFVSALHLCNASPFASRRAEGDHFFVRPITLRIVNLINEGRKDRGLRHLQEMISLTELAREYCTIVADKDELSHHLAERKDKLDVVMEWLISTDEILREPRLYSFSELLARVRDSDDVAFNTVNILSLSPSHSMGLWDEKARYIGVYSIPKGDNVYTTIYIGTVKE